MSARAALGLWAALLASFIIWTLIDVEARSELCKSTGGYLSHRNSIHFECVKDEK